MSTEPKVSEKFGSEYTNFIAKLKELPYKFYVGEITKSIRTKDVTNSINCHCCPIEAVMSHMGIVGDYLHWSFYFTVLPDLSPKLRSAIMDAADNVTDSSRSQDVVDQLRQAMIEALNIEEE